MQEMAGGDYIRTPVIFWGLDNLVFVGVIKEKSRAQYDPARAISNAISL